MYVFANKTHFLTLLVVDTMPPSRKVSSSRSSSSTVASSAAASCSSRSLAIGQLLEDDDAVQCTLQPPSSAFSLPNVTCNCRQLDAPQFTCAQLMGREDSAAPNDCTAARLMYADLTDQERKSLPDCRTLVRHYRAENRNLDAALRSLRQALTWRRTFRVDDLCNHHSTVDGPLLATENATGKIYCRGYSVEGRAILYLRPGLENTTDGAANIRHLVFNLEKAIACTTRRSSNNEKNIPLEKVILIIDYTGFSLRNAPPMSTSKATLDVLQKYYPERLYRGYLFHPPTIFRVFWRMVQPFIDPHTKQKICFLLNTNAQDQLSETVAIQQVEHFNPQLRPFSSADYLKLPLNHCFDEETHGAM